MCLCVCPYMREYVHDESFVNYYLYDYDYQWQVSRTKQNINLLRVFWIFLFLTFYLSLLLCMSNMRDKWSTHHLFVCLFFSLAFFIACGWFSNDDQIGQEIDLQRYGTFIVHFEEFPMESNVCTMTIIIIVECHNTENIFTTENILTFSIFFRILNKMQCRLEICS